MKTSLSPDKKKLVAVMVIALLGTMSFIQLSSWTTVNPVIGFSADRVRYPRHQEPDFLTFEELKRLYQNPDPKGALGRKLAKFWKTPVIDNHAYFEGHRARLLTQPPLGSYLSVLSWNIEKSFHIAEVIKFLRSDAEFFKMMDEGKAPRNSEAYQNLLRQRERMLNSNILILQEMDIGNKRSGYVDAAKELASALDMNYAYAAEQLEIDPVILGLEKIKFSDGTVDEKATAHFAADPRRYQGVFGSAVLSRYPIKRARVFQLKHQGYDWYHGEKSKTTFLEGLRRFGSEAIFENEITREIKKGGRIFFRVDLDVPELPGGTLTIIDIHLEIKCEPIARQMQMAEILQHIRGIRNPVIVSGDFNVSDTDLSPTSVSRTTARIAKNPTTWFSAAVTYLSPHALVINTSRFFSNVTKNFQDPTARDIPVIAPNKVKGLFDTVRDFRFDDGHAFDFRGDARRSINGNDGTLANSNQRDFKGFKTTFSVKRPLGALVGKYRLDWMFIKSYLKDSEGLGASPYRFAPHFGETLEELNTGLTTQLSDHHPNVVDLPFHEPRLAQ